MQDEDGISGYIIGALWSMLVTILVAEFISPQKSTLSVL